MCDAMPPKVCFINNFVTVINFMTFHCSLTLLVDAVFYLCHNSVSEDCLDAATVIKENYYTEKMNHSHGIVGCE